MIPTLGERHTQKIFGAVDLYAEHFYYHQDRVFNGLTYVGFLEQLAGHYPDREVFIIQDNATYHQAPEVQAWLAAQAEQFHLEPLPAYSPEFNAVEGIWHHTRVTATHDRYFATPAELKETLHSTFQSIQRRPEQITGYLAPFL
jgi:putative transposase